LLSKDHKELYPEKAYGKRKEKYKGILTD